MRQVNMAEYIREDNKSWPNIFLVLTTNSMMSTLLETASQTLENVGWKTKNPCEMVIFQGLCSTSAVYQYWHRTLWRSFLLWGKMTHGEPAQNICNHIRRMHIITGGLYHPVAEQARLQDNKNSKPKTKREGWWICGLCHQNTRRRATSIPVQPGAVRVEAGGMNDQRGAPWHSPSLGV